MPAYNEEGNLLPFYEALKPVLMRLPVHSEILFVNDGSDDGTSQRIAELALKDRAVKGVNLSRNFGSHAAILAGLRLSTGNAAVVISADLQDPPEIIAELLEKWENGAHVVWAVRKDRQDPFLKKLFAKLFYFMLRKTALPNYPAQGMDFGLFDRRVIDALSRIKEMNYFIFGVIVWMGFRQEEVPYSRRARTRGSSKWPFWKRVKAALDAIISFSYVPIRFIVYSGLAISLLSVVGAIILIVNRVVFGLGAAGWPSLMVTILFLGGVQLVTLGMLGEYIWRGNDQAKGRPQYIVMDKINFQEEETNESSAYQNLDRG